jgi:addiction module RelE/StbE family toxin
MLIEWSEPAEADLAEILSYFISQHEEDMGKTIISHVIKSVDRLASNPLSGRIGRINGTRELIIRQFPYIVYYRIVDNKCAEIVRVLHTARLLKKSYFKTQ